MAKYRNLKVPYRGAKITKFSVEAGNLVFDVENNRFGILFFKLSFIQRLLILLTGKNIFEIKNASLLFYKVGKINENTPNS